MKPNLGTESPKRLLFQGELGVLTSSHEINHENIGTISLMDSFQPSREERSHGADSVPREKSALERYFAA